MKRRPFPAGPDKVLAIDPKALGQEYEQGIKTTAQPGTVACIEIFGPIEQRAGWFGPGYDTTLAAFREALAMPEVGAVLLHIDSPGGDAAGMAECVRSMIDAKREAKKPVVAFSDESCYSAAYALACVADEIYLPDTAGVGSIGCLCVAMDVTEAVRKAGVNAVVVRSGPKKAQGHPLIPLDDATLADMQGRVDGLAQVFAEIVAESRGVSARKLLALKGACFFGEDAVSKGLADGIMSLDDVMAGLVTRVTQSVPLDNVPPGGSVLTHRSKNTRHEEKPMGLTELYAALAAAQAAGDTAKVASLNMQISAKKADAEEETSEEEESEEESKDHPKKDPDDDEDAEDAEEEEKPEEEEEETKKTTTVKTYRRSKKSQAAVAEAVDDIFPGLSAAQVRGKLMALKDGHDRVEKLEKKVKAVRTQQRNEEARKLVSQGVKSGKIPPSQRDFWLAQASKKDGLTSLREYLKTAVPVVSGHDAPGFTPGFNTPGPDGLTAEEQQICTRMGTAPADFIKTKARMPTHSANQTGATPTGFTIVRPMFPNAGGN